MPLSTYSYEQQLINEIKSIPKEYQPNLLKIIKLFHETIELKPAEDSFKQGWKEVLNNETMSVSELWEGIDAE